MPFHSEKQRKFLFKHEPKLAKRWAHEYGTKPQPSIKGLKKAAKKRG